MKKNILAKKITVTGKVQGVGFRYFVKQKAESMGIGGWVRNTVDGAVEIFAEAEDYKINILINFCKKGSVYSNVENIGIQSVQVEGNIFFKIKI
ncbi:MAG: acylphosphatase [Bacteroidota bacterium]|nr:acylphosphatase [Bacteroidota bacterium]